MQVGIMSGHFPRPTLEQTLDAILARDIRHLQFNMSSAHLNGPLADVVDTACPAIRDQVGQRNMVIAALGGPVNMVHPDPEKRRHAIERLKLLISACGPIGTSVIATCTGSRHPESMWRHHPDNASAATWRILLDALEQLLPVAEAAGVTLAFEPEVNNVCSDARLSRRLFDDVASPKTRWMPPWRCCAATPRHIGRQGTPTQASLCQ